MNIGIYAIRNLANAKMYIGQTSVSFDSRFREHRKALRGKRHYNQHLQHAWDKYGEAQFEFQVLVRCPNDDLDKLEEFYIQSLGTADQNKGYNLDYVVFGFKRHSAETKAKISEAHKGRIVSEETRHKIAQQRKGVKASDQAKAKMSAAGKGKKRSLETRAKMAIAATGRKPSDETRAKISATHKGVKFPEDRKAKMRGHSPSKETRAKLSKASKGRIQSTENRALKSESLRKAWARRKLKQEAVDDVIWQP